MLAHASRLARLELPHRRRRVWNSRIDRRRAMIARCKSPADVASAVRRDRVRAAYGPAKYEELARIKALYDPRNMLISM